MHVQAPTTPFSPWHVNLAARREKLVDQSPGVEFVAERQAGQNSLSIFQLRQLEYPLGDALGALPGGCCIDFGEA